MSFKISPIPSLSSSLSCQITKVRASTWKTPGMKAVKSYKHVVLIPLSDIRSLVDINSSSLSIDGKFS